MRIVHLVDYYNPVLHYQEYHLAIAQQRAGHEVHIVTSTGLRPGMSMACDPYIVERTGMNWEDGVRVHRLSPTVRTRNTPLIVGLVGYIDHLNPDVVHCHEMLYHLSTWLIAVFHKAKFRLICDWHASSTNTRLENSIIKKIYIAGFRHIISPLLLKRIDELVAIGFDEREIALKLTGADSVEVIGLGSDLDLYRPDPVKAQNGRQRLDCPEGRVVLFSGKIEPAKDIGILLKAFAEAKSQIADAHLILVGGFPNLEYQQSVAELINSLHLSESVKIVPWVTSDVLSNFYSCADAIIFPGNPSISILDALASGGKVVLSRSTNDRLNVRLVDNVNAFLFERGNSAELASVLVNVLSGSVGTRVSENARNLAESRLAWTQIAKEFMQVYRHVD